MIADLLESFLVAILEATGRNNDIKPKTVIVRAFLKGGLEPRVKSTLIVEPSPEECSNTLHIAVEITAYKIIALDGIDIGEAISTLTIRHSRGTC